MNDHPLLIFITSFVVLSLAASVASSQFKWRGLDSDAQDDFAVVIAATLTLLGLIIGFTFSMATSRYDQRKNYEETEANAIGTEFVRVDLLSPADAATARALLVRYLNERILFYTSRDKQQLGQIYMRTEQLQREMWSVVQAPAIVKSSPATALTLSGMNDVLNSQGYTQAAWWNRVPPAAWYFMLSIALCSNLLLGYRARHIKRKGILLMIVPLVVSVAFMQIADIDSPRGGLIKVNPQNLISVLASISGH